jgi:hypothetical protein
MLARRSRAKYLANFLRAEFSFRNEVLAKMFVTQASAARTYPKTLQGSARTA